MIQAVLLESCNQVFDGSGLIMSLKTVSNVPPVKETNVPPSVATSRPFFRNHDYLCDVKPRQIIYRGETKCPFNSENHHQIRERTLPNRKDDKICSPRNEKASRNAVGLLFLSSIRINWLILQSKYSLMAAV